MVGQVVASLGMPQGTCDGPDVQSLSAGSTQIILATC